MTGYGAFSGLPGTSHAPDPAVTNQAGSNGVTSKTDGTLDSELAELAAAVDQLETAHRQLAPRIDAIERTLRRLRGDGR